MNDFSKALKYWRRTRRYSQLDLAAEADVSLKHVSFLETGRTNPSRDMIGRLGDALHLPLSARNELLSAAGFAARYRTRAWDDEQMAPVIAAMAHILTGHDPYPGLVVDRLWRVRMMNPAATRLFGALGVAEGDSLLELMMSEHLPHLVENWPQLAALSLRRFRAERTASGGSAELEAVIDHLAKVPAPADAPDGPVIPTIYRNEGMRLSMFALISQFGTPEDAALDDLKIELYFPADDDTAAYFRETAS